MIKTFPSYQAFHEHSLCRNILGTHIHNNITLRKNFHIACPHDNYSSWEINIRNYDHDTPAEIEEVILLVSHPSERLHYECQLPSFLQEAYQYTLLLKIQFCRQFVHMEDICLRQLYIISQDSPKMHKFLFILFDSILKPLVTLLQNLDTRNSLVFVCKL